MLLMLSQSRTRRIAIVLSVVALGILLIQFLARVFAFAQLFGVFGPHAGIRITQVQIAEAYNATAPDTRTPVIPKIIHQIFHNWADPGNATLPSHWRAARQSCIDFNPGWEFPVWNMNTSRAFIEDEFPWFLSTYDGYRFPIQRVDVLRYFLLRHYGGFYLDMDNGCASSLEAMAYLPAFTTDGGVGALSNNIMGAQPNHPWFHLLTENLIPYNWNWILPYIIISWTSGQWFVTAMFEKYHSLLQDDGIVRGFENFGPGFKRMHHVLMANQNRPGADPWVFFTQVHGGTWTNWDSYWFGLLGDHIVGVLLTVFLTISLLVSSCCWCSRRGNKRHQKGYEEVPSTDEP